MRTRRTAESARRQILEAAIHLLREGGPEAIRLIDIGREVGMTHATILHHFESRENLIRNVVFAAIADLEGNLTEALRSMPPTEATAAHFIEAVHRAMAQGGSARLLAWVAEHPEITGERDWNERLLQRVAQVVAGRRAEIGRQHGFPEPPFEDTEFVVRLVSAALVGDEICGQLLNRGAGYDEGDTEVRSRFRSWLSTLIAKHLTSFYES